MSDKPFNYAEAIGKLTDEIKAIVDAVNELARQMEEVYAPAINKIYDAMKDYYVSIGEPCGKGKRGFNKWLKSLEQQEVKDE